MKTFQTFPSTSDVQIQITANTNTVGTQTDQENPEPKVQQEHNVANEIINYLKKELVDMQHKLQRVETMQKKLEEKPNSTCSKDCYKKKL